MFSKSLSQETLVQTNDGLGMGSGSGCLFYGLVMYVMSLALLCKVLVAVLATSSAFHTLSRIYNLNSNNCAYLYVPVSVT